MKRDLILNIDINKTYSPFSWQGGKRRLLNELSTFYPKKFNNFYEPFVGGMSILLNLIEIFGKNVVNKAFLNDINSDLIQMYKIMKLYPFSFLYHYKNFKDNNDIKNFNELRSLFNKKILCEVSQSSLLFFLLHGCFNGLSGWNSKNELAATKGFDQSDFYINNFFKFSQSIPNLKNFTNLSFQDFFKKYKIKKDDLIYFDPPYVPINKHLKQTRYYGKEFDETMQLELFDLFKKFDKKGAFVIHSNSYCDFNLNLYRNFQINIVKCKRNMCSLVSARNEVNEIIVIGNTLKEHLENGKRY